ncbi:MAG: hypothetical protein JO316_14720 [Abitibacteriaceae bacterium]|nr:hypothetical protein [Abditibacteriaceae bacterium]
MKQQKWIVGSTALVLVLGTVGSALASTPSSTNGIRIAQAPGKKKGKKGKGGKQGGGAPLKMLENALGRPLTDKEKQGVLDSYKTYQEGVAKSVGLTVPELQAKMKAYRAAHRGQAKGGAGATAAPAAH